MDVIDDTSAAQDWEKIQALFPARRAMRPNKAWYNGLSTRLGRDRLTNLLSTPSAGHLAAILDQCSDERLKALRTYAAINLEQATSAFRVTMIGNVTTPIILLSIAHQLTDGGVGKIFELIHQGDVSVMFGMVFAFIFLGLIIFFVLVYALACLNQARDIRHLIDLFAADRGVYFGLEDSGDLSSP